MAFSFPTGESFLEEGMRQQEQCADVANRAVRYESRPPEFFEARNFLNRFRLGSAVDKSAATHQEELEGVDGHAYFSVERADDLVELREKILNCDIARFPLCLSEKAPKLCRVFFDLDTNKEAAQPPVTLRHVTGFVSALQRFFKPILDVGSFRVTGSRGLVATPGASGDVSDQKFPVFCASDIEPGETVEHATERTLREKGDPLIAFIIRSDFHKRTLQGQEPLCSYHVVFPMIYSDRDALARACEDWFDMKSSTENHRRLIRELGDELVSMFLKDPHCIDISVIRNGSLRAPFCDKAGQNRSFRPAAVIHPKITGSAYTREFDDRFFFNASSLLVPFVDSEQPQTPPEHHASVEEKTMDDWRKEFVASPEDQKYNPRDLINIVEDVYEGCSRDEHLCRQGMLEAVASAVTAYLNLHVAFLEGSSNVSFVTKSWIPGTTSPQFLLRSEKAATLFFCNSETSVLWPPPSRGPGVKSKAVTLTPFRLWCTNPKRVTFSRIVVCPPDAVPQPRPDELNIWHPPEISKEEANGHREHSIDLPVPQQWIAMCEEWADLVRKKGLDPEHLPDDSPLVLPPSSAENKWARVVFARREIILRDGAFRRVFRINTFLAHIHRVLCDSNDDLFWFVMDWFAHLIQHPGRKMRSALVFIGEEGCGKNFVVDTIGSILGPGLYLCSQSHCDLDHFNSILAGRALYVLNECTRLSAKDHASLRTLITEGTMRLEAKFQDPIQISNLLNVVLMSNVTTHTLFDEVSAKARRWCMCRCGQPPTVEQDPLYFKGLWAWLGLSAGCVGNFGKVPGVLAVADRLYNHALSEDFDSSKFPQTRELGLQKLMTMQPIHLWWHECLLSGQFIGQDSTMTHSLSQIEQASFAPLSDESLRWLKEHIQVEPNQLFEKCFQASKYSGSSNKAVPIVSFIEQLKSVGGLRQIRPNGPAPRPRVWIVPSLAECRASFCDHFVLDPLHEFDAGCEIPAGH